MNVLGRAALALTWMAAAVLPMGGLAAEAAPAMAKMQHGKLQLGASVLFTPDGAVLAVSKQGDHVVLSRSTDLGKTWTEPTKVNAQPETISADGQNRPKIALASDGGVLVSWTHPLPKAYTGAVRLARSSDGQTFGAPLTVHRDTDEITHRFESLLPLPGNKVVVAWIDKREYEAAKVKKTPYRGAGIYAAMSIDGGKTFQREYKLADHSCECCRLGSAIDSDGAPLFLWRHVFEPNERDHALARLKPDGTLDTLQRATFDRWKLDGCPHHGPSLAVDAQGVRHAVWFNQKDGEGRVFYGRLVKQGQDLKVEGQQPVGGKRAAHADLAVAGNQLAVAWTEFDGDKTLAQAMVSVDGGKTFKPSTLGETDGASSQISLIRRGDALFAFWNTEKEGLRLMPLP